MKILVVGLTDSVGGLETFFMNYFRNMGDLRPCFDFLSYEKKFAFGEEVGKFGCKVYTVRGRGKNYFSYRKDMADFFHKAGSTYEAVWLNTCSLSNMDALIFAKKYGIPVRIIHSHNSDNMGSFVTGLLHRLNRRQIAAVATDFWACSGKAANYFYSAEILGSKTYRQVNNAIDLSCFYFDGSKREEVRKRIGVGERRVVGHVGRMHTQKNHKFLLKIFHEIYKKAPDALLLLIGDGELRNQVEDQIASYGLQDSVLLLGARSDIPDLMQAMDLFLFPSLYEGLGIVLIEAQAVGLPCIISETVPKEAVIVEDNVISESLNTDPGIWAVRALALMENKRRDTSAEIRNRGYDIGAEAEKMRSFFTDSNERGKR